MPHALQVFGFFGAVLIAYPAIAWLERRSTADVFRPTRLLQSPLQPLADVLKLLGKRGPIPENADRVLMRTGPFFGAFAVLMVMAVLPVAPLVTQGAQVGLTDGSAPLLLPFAFLLLSTCAIAFGGAGSGNPLALLTALRLSLVRVSTLVTALVACLAIVRVGRTSAMNGIVAAQQQALSTETAATPAWGVLTSPVSFAVALLCFALLAQGMHRSREGRPHDLGESYVAQMTGPLQLATRVFEVLDVFACASLLCVVFFGGWSIPFVDDGLSTTTTTTDALLRAGVFMAKSIGLSAGIVFLRRALPSFAPGQLWRFVWLVLLPIAVFSIFVPLAVFLPRA